MASIKMPMWTLEDALNVSRELQPLALACNYHIALGGGVLNAGSSDKDLDLYCLSLGDNEQTCNPQQLRTYLIACLGAEYVLGGSALLADTDIDEDAYLPDPTYHSGRFTYRGDYGRRTDVFIV